MSKLIIKYLNADEIENVIEIDYVNGVAVMVDQLSVLVGRAYEIKEVRAISDRDISLAQWRAAVSEGRTEYSFATWCQYGDYDQDAEEI